jgi:hypothetical protein
MIHLQPCVSKFLGLTVNLSFNKSLFNQIHQKGKCLLFPKAAVQTPQKPLNLRSAFGQKLPLRAYSAGPKKGAIHLGVKRTLDGQLAGTKKPGTRPGFRQ